MPLGIRDPEQRLAKYLLHQEALHSGDEIALKLEDIAAPSTCVQGLSRATSRRLSAKAWWCASEEAECALSAVRCSGTRRPRSARDMGYVSSSAMYSNTSPG